MSRNKILAVITKSLNDKDNDIWQYGEFGKLPEKILNDIEESEYFKEYVDEASEELKGE